MASGKGTEAVGDVAALGRLAGDAQALGEGAKKLGARAKAGAAAAVIARDLLAALVLASVGMIFYGVYRGLEMHMAAPTAALAIGGTVLVLLLIAAVMAVKRLLPRRPAQPTKAT